MITDREVYKVEGTTDGEKVAMGVNVEDMPHIMGLLANAYSDKPLAIIREYSTNAWDAHVEAGTDDRPIETTLPSDFAPFLKIKDHGVGLNAEDIRTIYARYGASTKRGTNDQNGTFGIGCKAALSYCSQFTVTSVKDGRKVVVSVSRESDGSGSMELISDAETTESNGTEVTVPVARNDINTFAAKAADFYSVWKPGTVLVNGEQPKHFKDSEDVIELDTDLFALRQTAVQPRIVMGNVAYPAPALHGVLGYGITLLAFVGIGDVTIPHSRESLQDAKNTTETLEKVRARAQGKLADAVQREIDACGSHSEALTVYSQWQEHLLAEHRAGLTYKGDAIPDRYVLPGYIVNPPWNMRDKQPKFIVSSCASYERDGNSTEREVIQRGAIPKVVWILGFEPQKFTATHKRKTRQLLNKRLEATNNTWRPASMVCVRKQYDWKPDAFTEPHQILQWADVKAEKLPKEDGGSSGRIPGSYDIYTESGSWKIGIPGDEIRKGKPIYWCHGSWRDNYALARNFANLVGDKEFTLVALTENRIAKFKRNVPKAKEAREAIKEKYSKWEKRLTADQRKALAINDAGFGYKLTELDAGRIDDPELREMMRLAKLDVSSLETRYASYTRYIPFFASLEDVENPLATKYPLANRNNRWGSETDKEHVYLYINAVYAANI